jgi:ATP-dependent RNA helicase RhlE
MASFQEGNLRGLITTDIMARGLDISNITHVVI